MLKQLIRLCDLDLLQPQPSRGNERLQQRLGLLAQMTTARGIKNDLLHKTVLPLMTLSTPRHHKMHRIACESRPTSAPADRPFTAYDTSLAARDRSDTPRRH